MGPLTLFTNIFSEPSLIPVLSMGRCLRKRLNTNQCQRCIESCPSAALTVNDREIVLNEDKCTGCMACTSACPQDALESEYDVNEVVRSCKGDSDLVFSCVRQKQTGPDEIVLPCVGILSKQALSAIFFNKSKSVAINVAGCGKCCNQKVSATFVNEYRLLAEVFSEVKTSKIVLIHNDQQLRDIIVDRRLYLTNIRNIVTKVTKKSIAYKRTTQPDEKKTTRRIPVKVQLLKDVIAQSDSQARIKILGVFSRQLSINDNCTVCPLCKGICPTGAIQLERSEGGKKLHFNSLTCSGCGLCVEFCKKDALSIY